MGAILVLVPIFWLGIGRGMWEDFQEDYQKWKQEHEENEVSKTE